MPALGRENHSSADEELSFISQVRKVGNGAVSGSEPILKQPARNTPSADRRSDHVRTRARSLD